MRSRINRGGWQSLAVVVEASDGVIALWGVVRSAAEREALEDLANTIEGVRHVDNRLAVEPGRSAGSQRPRPARSGARHAGLLATHARGP
jgi:hypothetical protein